MTEARTSTPDEAPIPSRELPGDTRLSLDELLAFIQANDGFTGYGQFHFFANGCEYAGQYESNEVLGAEKIDVTRRGEGILDRGVVNINPRSEKTPHFIAYADYANGRAARDNTYGALRGTRAITSSPRQPVPEA